MESKPAPMTSVLDEAHDFQRFERVFLHRTGGRGFVRWVDGRLSRELKIVCRCGWAAHASLEQGEEAAARAARDLLQGHVSEAIDRARRPS